MVKYVSIEVLSEWLKTESNKYGMKDVAPVGWTLLSLVNELHKVPTADVVERKHGKWELKHWAEERDNRLIDNYECSICHNWVGDATDFCPNCGAWMESEGE